jgi:hypothetical protein
MTDTDTQTVEWHRVKEHTERAASMHFDGCHKIYLAMDEGQTREYQDLGYEIVAPSFDQLDQWYDQSCALRFVTATTSTCDGTEFESLIPQFFGQEEDTDEPGDE